MRSPIVCPYCSSTYATQAEADACFKDPRQYYNEGDLLVNPLHNEFFRIARLNRRQGADQEIMVDQFVCNQGVWGFRGPVTLPANFWCSVLPCTAAILEQKIAQTQSLLDLEHMLLDHLRGTEHKTS